MAASKAFYVTTPIYYVNDAPHIGHAYTTMVGDVLTRWHRMRGEQVWYLTGTDEHGQKVEAAAAANGVSPQQWVDTLVTDKWLPVLHTIDVANDDFIRTTQPRHTERVQRFMSRLHEQGWFYLGDYSGPYCVGCEEFKLADDLIDGEGEYAGSKCCPVHSRPVQELDEHNWFFKLSEFRERLIEHYESNPDALQPRSAYNEVMSFLRGELKDLSISRSTFDWGIPLPWDSNHVVYVWFDALLNYATAIGLDDDDAEGAAKFAATWPANVHLVGKDILRFHAVIWPAMLMAAGLPLPGTVFAHGWLLVGGEKMSKSKLTGIAPSDIVDTFGSDAFRYYFLRAIAFGSDGSFSWEDMAARYTNELANGLGNLASRATAMVDRYFGGALPASLPTDAEISLQTQWRAAVEQANAAVDRFEFAAALATTKEFVDALNLYLTEQEPWKVAKTGTDEAMQRVGTVLATVCEGLRGLAVMLHPVMPKATTAMWRDLGAEMALGALAEQRIDAAGVWDLLPVGTAVTKGEPLFPRLPDEE